MYTVDKYNERQRRPCKLQRAFKILQRLRVNHSSCEIRKFIIKNQLAYE